MDYNITKSGRLALVNCSDSFTFSDHELFRELLIDLSGMTDVDTITFDMNRVNFLDSAAIGMLIIANDEAASRKQTMAVCGAQDQVKMALEIADLKSLLTVRD